MRICYSLLVSVDSSIGGVGTVTFDVVVMLEYWKVREGGEEASREGTNHDSSTSFLLTTPISITFPPSRQTAYQHVTTTTVSAVW
jgi:hypothetical protein